MAPPSPTDAARLLDAAPVALLHVGVDRLLRHANPAARALCGEAAAPGLPLAGLFNTGVNLTPLHGTERTPQRLALRGPPERWVELSAQALAEGGWMVALRRTRAQHAPSTTEASSALALAVELGNIAVWRHDLATHRVHYNDQAYRVLDIPPRAAGLSLEEVRGFIHPDDLPLVLASATEALAGSGPTDMEARYRRADGTWRRVMTRRVLERAADGTPLAFIGVALDVTPTYEQQRRADEMTRRFELATRSAGIGYWVLERGAPRATWSEALRALFALSDGQPVPTLQEWLQHHVHPDDREGVRSRFATWVRSGDESLVQNLRVLRTDGSVRHVVTHSRRDTRDGAYMLFGVVIDLSERRDAELALRRATERVALAAHGAGLGTWEIDRNTDQVFWDEQMWLLRGQAPQPRAMSTNERNDCVHPDDRANTCTVLDRAMQQRVPYEHEFRVVWPDGQVRWLASRSVEVHDDAAGTHRRIGVNWDITDKRTAEGARQEREIALGESRAKSQFLARMSHELRTPLNAVLGFAQLLVADDTGSGAAATTRRRRLNHIRSAGQHLLTLINDVLDLSSVEGGELRIALQPVALAPLVQQTLPLLGTLRDQHRVTLHLGALQGSVLADATRLRQVLLNLLSNAIKYNREGGTVTVEAEPQGSMVLLRISDSGRGMNDEQLRHLFEPFNRLGRQQEGDDAGDTIEGSGIGLAIVKALVQRMGGTVQVRSTPAAGSVFEVLLADASTQTAAPGVHASASRPLALRADAQPLRGRLLYIEDNPVNALIISELLARRSDLQLHIAEDGERGVQKALALQPDLVLLDMQLPDMDGFEVMRRLRTHAALAKVPVIALSANAMPDDIEQALRAGMSDYWTKPLDFTAFMASIESLFGPAPR